MSILLWLWLAFWGLVIPAFLILHLVGILTTPDKERFEQENQEKSTYCKEESCWGPGRRLALAGALFALLLGVYGLIIVGVDRHWGDAIGLAFWKLIRVGVPIAVLGYVGTGLILRRRRMAFEHQAARKLDRREWPKHSLHTIIYGGADLDWTTYAGYRVWDGRRLLGASFLLQIICVTTAILIFVGGFKAGFQVTRVYHILGTFTIAAVVFIGVRFSRMARPHYALLELERMASSLVPPVIFLRAFMSDRESFENANVFGNPMRWVDWKIEDVLAKEFRIYGPVFALGQAELALTPTAPGAVRLYVRAGWQKTVQDLCDLSRLILVRASFSHGVEWELKEVLRPDRRTRTAILLINDQGRPMDRTTYLDFREHVAATCDFELPLEGWNCWYVWFDQNGASKLIEAASGEVGSGFDVATGILLIEKANEAKGEWQRLSVWDFYIPLEYRVLAWGPATVLMAIFAAWLIFWWDI